MELKERRRYRRALKGGLSKGSESSREIKDISGGKKP